MTRRSILPGVVRYDLAQYDNEEAFGAGFARVVSNNLAHLADDCGQVAINVPAGSQAFKTRAIAAGSAPHLVWTSAPFQIRRLNPRSYRLRVRIRAALATGNATTTAIILHPEGQDPCSWVSTSAYEQQRETYSHSSTSAAWLTPTGTGIVSLSSTVLSACRATEAQPDIESASVFTTDYYRAKLSVVSYSAGGDTLALWALYAAETVGVG